MVQLTEKIIMGKTRLEKLEDVKNLNLDLDDCTILAQLPNLEVLSLSVNRLTSLKDFRHCSKLQELYLRKNDVRDLTEIQHLANLKDLRVLWLSDNPARGGGGGGRSNKNILYAVMALLGELGEDDLVYVRREIEQRTGAR
ncbi:hypothetical protein TSOC_013038 [Tetrabaena socialis]|uniref:Protein phosphatase 1 regulatory subunit 7 n=1 Tax=Tetrabaena socialis TaxID=47790 RepID=A0A2J7ZLF4_9CHLO|nr:hypothetical protein TSOC_013038 [Tetrabaena socialis]|eukprot:PNH01093.1 hypothetical protein TSOC_013038 [Tetrabaena socialis]